MKPILSLLVLSCTLVLAGCGAGDDDEHFESAEEARYAKAGRPFAQAIFKQDFAAAYDMLSSHAKARMSRAEFEAYHLAAHEEYFVPAHAEKARVVEMDAHVLTGDWDAFDDPTDRAIAQMSMERYVGDVPDDVPNFIRVASLSAPFYDMDPNDVDSVLCHFTYLLVEEGGELKVAHFFYRWNDMLD